MAGPETQALPTAKGAGGVKISPLDWEQVEEFLNDAGRTVYAEFELDKTENKIITHIEVVFTSLDNTIVCEYKDTLETIVDPVVFEEFSDEEIYKRLHKLIHDFNAVFDDVYYYKSRFDWSDDMKTFEEVANDFCEFLAENVDASLEHLVYNLECEARLRKEERKRKEEDWGDEP